MGNGSSRLGVELLEDRSLPSTGFRFGLPGVVPPPRPPFRVFSGIVRVTPGHNPGIPIPGLPGSGFVDRGLAVRGTAGVNSFAHGLPIPGITPTHVVQFFGSSGLMMFTDHIPGIM